MSIHKWKQYALDEHYDAIIANLQNFPALKDYIENQDYFKKDDNTKTINYKTELLCPSELKSRIPILLLFSNPHPKSVIAGMFLSPEKTVNRFWLSMKDAEMFKLPSKSEIKKDDFPESIRTIFLNLQYDSPFAFYFYTYFSFPSGKPEDLKEIFGSFFHEHIVPESRVNLHNFVEDKNIRHIICFGKQAFQYISNYSEGDLGGYTKKVEKDGFIHSKFICKKDINLYLTCPTGQGGCKAEDRIRSLKCIKDDEPVKSHAAILKAQGTFSVARLKILMSRRHGLRKCSLTAKIIAWTAAETAPGAAWRVARTLFTLAARKRLTPIAFNRAQ